MIDTSVRERLDEQQRGIENLRAALIAKDEEIAGLQAQLETYQTTSKTLSNEQIDSLVYDIDQEVTDFDTPITSDKFTKQVRQAVRDWYSKL